MSWRWYIFWSLSDKTISDYFFKTGILIGWTCENVQLFFLFCPFSKSYFSKATSLNYSNKVSIQVSVVNAGLFIKVFCMFGQCFMHHSDGKYRSATAPLEIFWGLRAERFISPAFSQNSGETRMLLCLRFLFLARIRDIRSSAAYSSVYFLFNLIDRAS